MASARERTASTMSLDEPRAGKRERGASHQLEAVACVSTASSESDQAVCWICLDAARADAPLGRACACPRFTHAACLARWQLQSAGSRKETHCEFCDGALPDWKAALTPGSGAAAPAVMNVNFDGRTYSFEVKPGIDGYRAFTDAIRRAFSLPDDSELNITFTCDEPCAPGGAPAAPTAAPGSLLTLQGAGAYDAAVHCASVSAARRLMQQGGAAAAAPPTPPQPAPLGAAPVPRGRDDLADDATSSGAGSGAGPSARRPRSGDRGAAPASQPGLGRKLRNAIADILSAK